MQLIAFTMLLQVELNASSITVAAPIAAAAHAMAKIQRTMPLPSSHNCPILPCCGIVSERISSALVFSVREKRIPISPGDARVRLAQHGWDLQHAIKEAVV
jgi:hypothetical protein